MELGIWLVVIILGMITWNMKQGFNMIDERLKDIHEIIQKNNKEDNT